MNNHPQNITTQREKAINVPLLAFMILIINIVIHLFKSYAPAPMVNYYFSIFALHTQIFHDVGDYMTHGYRLLTSMFIHSDIFHLVMNMSALLAFAKAIIDSLGNRAFLLIYLTSGLMANIGVLFVPIHDGWVIGASGAISGLLGAGVRQAIDSSLPNIAAPFLRNRKQAIRFGGGFILFNLALALIPSNVIIGLTDGNAGGIAWDAHLIGFFTGFLITNKKL